MSNPAATLAVSALLIVLLTSCQQAIEANGPEGRVRVSVVSSLSSSAELNLWAEGLNGQFLTGAKVIVRSPSGTVSLVSYVSGKGCFSAGVGGQGDGEYTVTVDSLAWKQSQVIRLDHQVLRSAPNLTSVTDGVGEVFSGASLDTGLPWTAAWAPVPGATSYFVQLTQGTSVLWSATTTDPVALIAARSLPAGTYSASVTAQYSSGDPLFVKAPYSSISHSVSASLTVYAK